MAQQQQSSEDSDFFSPITTTKLPQSHDTSWIGARMSPIHFDEDDDEPFVRPQDTSSAFVVLNQSSIHPLWDPPLQSQQPAEKARRPCRFAHILLSISTSLWTTWATLDVLAIKHFGLTPQTTTATWKTTWIHTDIWNTLLYGTGGRLLSLLTAISLWDLFLAALAWYLIAWASNKQQWYTHAGTYLSAATVGQLWAPTARGALLWGTGGVLCALGIHQPRTRVWLFGMTIWLVLWSLAEAPYGDPTGMVLGSVWGWALAGASSTNRRLSLPVLGARCVVLGLVLLPIFGNMIEL